MTLFGQPKREPPQTFRKDQRILKRRDFQRVFERGKSFRSKWIIVRIEKTPEGAEKSKIGLVISRKVEPKATRRNLWKRRVRNAVRLFASGMTPGFMVVVQARANPRLPKQEEIEKELKAILAESGAIKA